MKTLLFIAAFISIGYFSSAQYTLTGSTHINTSYEMGQFVESWDSLSYSYSANNNYVLDEYQPYIDDNGYLKFTQPNDFTIQDHFKNGYNDNLLKWNSYKKYYTDSILQKMEYYSYGNEESPSSYYLYSYNGTLLKSTILYSYRSNLEEYIISTATYYSYDINDREIEKVNEIYYTGVLNSVSVDSFFYEGDNLTKHLVYKGDNLDEVTFDHEIILLYDSSDRVIKNTWYEYDQDEEFRIKQQHTFIYTSTLLDTSTFTSYHFHNGDSYHSIYTYEYDEMDNLLRIEGRQNNSTEITKTTNFTYFDDNFLESYHVLYSDLTLGETKIIYHYGNPVLPSFESTIEPIISIFPNPTSDYLRFETSAQIQEINVFSINGQLHMNIDNPKTNNINIHNLPSGIYTIQLSIMNKVYNKLFVKE